MYETSRPELNNGIVQHLSHQENKSLLRILTCGSLGDGKSTLIGRLLYDTRLIPEADFAAAKYDNVRHIANDDPLGLALLLEGLEAEREQRATIDVAYHSFVTKKRKYMVVDASGDEEYTRKVVTLSATANLAVVLVDARKGILPHTRHHSFVVSMLGIRHIVLAVNKMDLVNFDLAVFDDIVAEYAKFSENLGFEAIQSIPLSACFGDNVVASSAHTSWYSGPTLLAYLETVTVPDDNAGKPGRFAVQHVSRPNPDFCGCAGHVASGRIALGETVIAAKSGRASQIRDIVTIRDSLTQACQGQMAVLVLEDQLDVASGDMLVPPDNRPDVADQFQAHVVWFDASPMIPGRNYILRTICGSVTASISGLKYRIDTHNFSHVAAKSLNMNEFGVCNVSLRAPVAFDAYKDNRATGNFVLIDRLSHATVGAGMIDFPLRRAKNIHLQALEVSKRSRAELMNQKPAALWFTGLSGSGKSTIANHLEKLLHGNGRHTILLDGDNIRHGLNRDLGFTEVDRVENIRRVAEIAKLMTEAGLIVIVSFISPFRAERQLARDLMEPGEFIEIFIDTPLEECVLRDPKGLYKRALSGDLRNFTGIDSPYEPPESPELHLRTIGSDPIDLAQEIEAFLERRL